ncbi:MAG: toprim domain-containing protein [Fibrobacteres bacterium]|nr:toprim domain-containing protein [Fibrobacterota bacterium]
MKMQYILDKSKMIEICEIITARMKGKWHEYYESRYKLQRGKNGNYQCPWPNNHNKGDKNASLSVDNMDGVWFCHGCGEKGNAATMYKELFGNTDTYYQEMIQSIGSSQFEEFLLGTSDSAEQALKENSLVFGKPNHSLTRSNKVMLNNAWVVERNTALLNNPDKLDFLLKLRGWYLSTIKKLRIGILEGKKHGYIIPVDDFDGKLANCAKYAPGSEYKWTWMDPGAPIYPYPTWILLSPRLIFAEGLTDTIAALSIGLPAVTLGGASNTNVEEKFHGQATKYLTQKECVIIFDDDDAGIKGAHKLASSLNKYAGTIKIVSLRKSDKHPNGLDEKSVDSNGKRTEKDLTDYIRINGGGQKAIDAIEKLIAQTEFYVPKQEVESESSDSVNASNQYEPENQVAGILTEQKIQHNQTQSTPFTSNPNGVTNSGAPSVKPVIIEYLPQLEPMNKFLERVTKRLEATQRFYVFEERLAFINDSHELINLDCNNLPGIINQFVEIAYMGVGDKGPYLKKYALLTLEQAKALIATITSKSHLPIIKIYTKAPVFDTSWQFIGTPGYHAHDEIYYAGPTITPVETLDTVFKMYEEFCFTSPADKANSLGMFVSNLYRLKQPVQAFEAISGNKPRIGKTTSPMAKAIVITGYEAKAITYKTDDEKFENDIATRVRAGDKIILIDNVKTGKRPGQVPLREIDSSVLERSITSPNLNFRLLATNTSISRFNDVQFVITMNNARLGHDLMQRGVPVNMRFDGNPRQRKFKNKEYLKWVRENRNQILAELAGMVLKWRKIADTIDYGKLAEHSVNQEWAATTDAILRTSGIEGFLMNFDQSEEEYSEETQCLRGLCENSENRNSFKRAAEWLEIIKTSGLQPGLLKQRESERAQVTVTGQMLTRGLERIFRFPDGAFSWRSRPCSSGSGTLYGIQPIEEEK